MLDVEEEMRYPYIKEVRLKCWVGATDNSVLVLYFGSTRSQADNKQTDAKAKTDLFVDGSF